MSEKPRRVGITTTIPLEPFLASGTIPVDLNNTFISSSISNEMVEEAQVKGFPRNICTWIKGLYRASDRVDGVVGVVRGDCSNTESLLQTLESEGKGVHPFSFPYDRSRERLVEEIKELSDFLGCTIDTASEQAGRVEKLRQLAREIDERRWKYLRITSKESHIAQVSSSDFDQEPKKWEVRMRALIEDEEDREPQEEGIRIGYIGVPPIITDIFPRIESLGGRTVFHEVQRQFTMPSGSNDWIQRYLDYTYPYDISSRVSDIKEQIRKRKISGVIHYVQSFCHRQIDDILFRRELSVPVLTIEGNLPGPMDNRSLIRLEAFLDVLEEGG